MKKINILVIGSKNYQNNIAIKDFIFKLSKDENRDKITIGIIASDYGVEKLIKKYALEFGVNFGEFNPYHLDYKMYEIMPKYLFGKNYHKKNFAIRDSFAIRWTNYIIAFIDNTRKDFGIDYQMSKIIKLAEKHNKTIKYIKE